ncbi:hypothetical protein MASR2M18_12810 [Ignavibacteria bacterium]|nr:argininosuccinate synthase [Bacteroidota bacterium]MCZ2133237.1 argininosuccinate synthase [Bacteroidota bacterium]
MDELTVLVAKEEHTRYSHIICETIEQAAKARGTGIAKRQPEYINKKIREGKAVIALHKNPDDNKERFVGFCYIETWGDKQYTANSGLIVVPEFRRIGLAKRIKQVAFELSRQLYPKAKLFGITTSHAVMKINTDLGYIPVPFSELTADEEFWNGCQSCPNYDILKRTERKLCLCTGMLYDPDSPRSAETKQVVVLAYSGGLDTSYCVKLFADEKNYAVHTVIVNTGGFSNDELSEIERNAIKLGAKKHILLDETANFYQRCLRFLIFGNILRNNTYPLSVSAERAFQAMSIARYASSIQADFVAHGSTGAGNDQARFDVMFNILLPGTPILTPIRDNKLSREDEITYLASRGFEQNWEKARYSINKGLWGTTVGGVETLTSDTFLPDGAFPTPITKTEPELLRLGFVQGELTSVNDEQFANPVDAIKKVAEIAQPFGIGRDIHVGDTIIGLKGRVGFEAAAPLIIIKAHHALEKHTLTKQQLAIKDSLAAQYGALLHEGQFLEPAMRDMEELLLHSQEMVSGAVTLHLAPYRFHVIGISSEHDLMNSRFGKYGEMNSAWTGEDVRGFAKIASNQTMMYFSVNGTENVG